MIKRYEDIKCPRCGADADEIHVVPTEHYDAPPEVYVKCPVCGSFDPQEDDE